MRVVEFNTEDGIYTTSIPGIETVMHSHPAIEMVIAERGYFSVHTKDNHYKQVTCAVFDANCPHALQAADCPLHIFIIERRDYELRENLSSLGISIDKGYYLAREENGKMALEKIQLAIKQSGSAGYDPRVLTAIRHMDQHNLPYSTLIKSLTAVTFLSESRLSHLFRQHTGVSLKKYFVWSKLKKAVDAHLHEQLDLQSAMLHSGFYDQAHFSKSYKSMLGISPSRVYKKRNLTS